MRQGHGIAGRSREAGVWAALCLLAIGAPARLAAQQLPLKIYTTADGLARNQVTRIKRDSRGFLWFCTPEGLSRFDGYEFTNYGVADGLPHRVVNDLLETRGGEYWVATAAGLCRFNPASTGKRFTTVDRPPGDARVRHVTTLLEDSKGTIWCGTFGGLCRLDRIQRPGATASEWQFALVDLGLPNDVFDDSIVSSLFQDHFGDLWIGTGTGLYRRLADGRHHSCKTPDGSRWGYPAAPVEDRLGGLWVSTHNGLYRFALPADRNQPPTADRVYREKDGLPSNRGETLLHSSDGRIWMGSSGGLTEFRPGSAAERPEFRTYTTEHGLSARQVWALGEDRDDNIWIGTDGGGAMKMARAGFTTYTHAEGLHPGWSVSLFQTRSGELYSTGRDGGEVFVSRLGKDRFRTVQPRLPDYITYLGWGWRQQTFEDRAGEWWIPTGQGLLRYGKVARLEQLSQQAPKAVYTTRSGLAGDDVFRLFEDSRADIWISSVSNSVSGLTRWERATETLHRYPQATAQNAASAFAEDPSGHVWIGFSGSGLAHVTGSRFAVLTAGDGLPAGFIQALHVDRAGRLWVAAGDGLARIDELEAERPRIRTYTTADGLSGNAIRAVLEDPQGRIYACTGRAIDRLDPRRPGRVKHYTAADGLPPGDIGVAVCDRSGALWFATSRGLSRLRPETEIPSVPPPVFVTGLRAGGVPCSISELGETGLSGIELLPDRRQIQIAFVGLSFAPGEALRYQHRLQPADRDWSAPARERSVHYANLGAGAYRFEVRAVNADGAASEPPAWISFRVAPPLWRRWWFLTLAAAAAGALVLALHRYRVARLLELERLRTRIATDLHDDLGSSLSQIAILSEVAARHVDGGSRQAVQPLAQIGKVSRELVDSMSDIVWAINPRNDRLPDLVYRMRRFSSDLLGARDICLQFTAAAEDLPVDAAARREVFLIFKESMHNILRHSGCTEARVEIGLERGWLKLQVSDNGDGFHAAGGNGSGNGLDSMRSRAQRLGGVLSVFSGSGAGCRVELRVPLAQGRHAAT